MRATNVGVLMTTVAIATLGLNAQAPPKVTLLGVQGQSNSAPSLASRAAIVVAAWTATSGNLTNVYIATSNDAGATFSAPRRVNDKDGEASANAEQPPRVLVTSLKGRPLISVFWSQRTQGADGSRTDIIRMSKSTDGGRIFSPARTIHDPAIRGARGWHSVADGSDGTIHVVWLDGRDAERRIASMKAAGSAMAGKGQPPQDVYHAAIMPDGRIEENVVAHDVCFCCKTAVAVETKGLVYAAWRHIFPGSMRDIAFATSRDYGRHFEPSVRVAEDNWQLNGCPEDGPAVAMSGSGPGSIHIVWPTLVNGTEKGIFYASSRDGRSFSPRVRISTPGSVNSGHAQIAAIPGGGVAIVWDEVVDGVRRVSITQFAAGNPSGSARVLSASESASNPAITATGKDMIVAWTARPGVKGNDLAEIRVVRLGS